MPEPLWVFLFSLLPIGKTLSVQKESGLPLYRPLFEMEYFFDRKPYLSYYNHLNMKTQDIVKELKFNKDGLIPAIIQDVENNEVLMLGYINKESFLRTLETGKVHFYSRSRQRLWLKGETSGHFQLLKEILLDCDNDTLLLKVQQLKGACHKGYRSCFYRKFMPSSGRFKIFKKKIFAPKKVYNKAE